jgi:hypothetical protein
MKSASAITAFLLIASSSAFSPAFTPATKSIVPTRATGLTQVYLSDKAKEETAEAVFIPPPEATEDDTEEDDDDVPLEVVESLGKGAAKVSFECLCRKRGSCKSGISQLLYSIFFKMESRQSEESARAEREPPQLLPRNRLLPWLQKKLSMRDHQQLQKLLHPLFPF